ncbi:MAG: TolB family protein [Actinomycetes bacterium]
MDVAATDTTGSDKPAATSLRAPYVGLAAGLLWAAAAYLAYRQLTPYPPRYAGWILGGGALWWGFTTWPVSAIAHRRTVNVLMVAAGGVLPFVLVMWVPGVAQPQEHAIPGAPTFAFSAAPDGTFDLYALPDGDAARMVELTDGGGSLFPQLSPDASQLAYSVPTVNGSDVWLMRLGQDWSVQSQTPLIQGSGSLYPVAWAPDGRLVVQENKPDGTARLEYADTSTGEVQPWMSGARVEYSPDGQRIVFCRPHRGDPQNQDIWVADTDGSHAHRVIATPGDDTSPAWSPDGQTIAFTSNVSGNDDVWTATADGDDQRDVTPQTPDSEDWAWGWSPKGQILFLSNRSHTGGVFFYFMEADGSGATLAVRI